MGYRLTVLWGKCTFREFHLFFTRNKKKTHQSATKGTCLVLSGKCAKSALKQSDSVANSNVQGTGRCTESSRTRDAGADPYSNILYIQGTKDKIQGPLIQSGNRLLSPVGI